jgi:hypothetical protein
LIIDTKQLLHTKLYRMNVSWPLQSLAVVVHKATEYGTRQREKASTSQSIICMFK